MNQKDLFRVPNKPWWWPRSFRFRVVWIWVVLFVVLMTLQNLGVIATSVRPFVLGLPFSLFFMLLLSFISTIVIVSIYSLWKDFRKRVAD
jgi:hypothetical protein